MAMYQIYPCSDKAQKLLSALTIATDEDIEAVGIESLPADTVYPLDAMKVGESIAVPMEGNAVAVSELCRESSRGTKQFAMVIHAALFIYEVVRIYDKITEQETKTNYTVGNSSSLANKVFPNRNRKYPFDQLEVGKSFFVPYSETKKDKLYNAMKDYGRRHGLRLRLVRHTNEQRYEVVCLPKLEPGESARRQPRGPYDMRPYPRPPIKDQEGP